MRIPKPMNLPKPPTRRFYNLYNQGSELFRQYHKKPQESSSDLIRKSGSSIRIYSDRDAETCAQNISNQWTKEGGYRFRDKVLSSELSVGTILDSNPIPNIVIDAPTREITKERNVWALIGHDGGEIAGLTFRTFAEVLCANGIDLLVNATSKDQIIETSEDVLRRTIRQKTLSEISFGIFISSHIYDENEYADLKIFNNNGIPAEISTNPAKDLKIRRSSFDAIISGNNPGVKNHGKIEMVTFR